MLPLTNTRAWIRKCIEENCEVVGGELGDLYTCKSGCWTQKKVTVQEIEIPLYKFRTLATNKIQQVYTY